MNASLIMEDVTTPVLIYLAVTHVIVKMDTNWIQRTNILVMVRPFIRRLSIL